MRIPFRNTFNFFQQVWGPRAAYHLTRVRFGTDWRDRLASAVWLINNRVPYSGAAPSLNFKGL